VEWKLSKGVLEELKCPNCKSEKFALILWGYLDLDKEMQNAVDNKKIVIGGCMVTDHDPKWECTACSHRCGERDEN